MAKQPTTTLDKMPTNSRCTIEHVQSDGESTTRFSEMGLLPGTLLLVKKRAPLGDPMEITVRGYSLCLRKSDSRRITVRPFPDDKTETEKKQ